MNKTLTRADLVLDLGINASTPDIAIPASLAPLFRAVEARRVPGSSFALLFAGAGPRNETAAISAAFARTAEQATALPVLFIDATGLETPTVDLLTGFRAGLEPAEMALPTGDRRVAWCGFGRAPVLPGAEIGRLLRRARDSFPLLVIDGGPLPGRALLHAVGRHCDGTVLVSRPGVADTASLALARVGAERAGATLIGAVLDGAEPRLPRWRTALA